MQQRRRRMGRWCVVLRTCRIRVGPARSRAIGLALVDVAALSRVNAVDAREPPEHVIERVVLHHNHDDVLRARRGRGERRAAEQGRSPSCEVKVAHEEDSERTTLRLC